MSAAMRVLFVCTGNICRSPAAARILAERAGGARIEVASAGTRAVVGSGVHPLTAAALAQRGIPTEGHAARDLSARLVRDADLILGMTRSHRSAAVRLDPAALRRAFALAEFARLCGTSLAQSQQPDGMIERLSARRWAASPPEADDIPDPIGTTPAGHDAAVERIAECIDRILASGVLGRR
jgi:protein-tyrosine phosphatase